MFPERYNWLYNLGPLPRMVQEALREFGTVEVPGPQNNLKIMSWAAELGLSRVYSADSVPWCGLMIALCAFRAGKPVVKDPLWALNWAKWGNNAGQPELGDVVTFIRPGGGHVALYIGEDATCYHVLGGNQSDQVCFTRIDKHRLHSARNFYAVAPPESARPYILQDSGIVSENEV